MWCGNVEIYENIYLFCKQSTTHLHINHNSSISSWGILVVPSFLPPENMDWKCHEKQIHTGLFLCDANVELGCDHREIFSYILNICIHFLERKQFVSCKLETWHIWIFISNVLMAPCHSEHPLTKSQPIMVGFRTCNG